MLEEKDDEDLLAVFLEAIDRRVDRMLDSEPIGAPADSIELWKRLKPLCTDQFETFHSMMTADGSCLDLHKTQL